MAMKANCIIRTFPLSCPHTLCSGGPWPPASPAGRRRPSVPVAGAARLDQIGAPSAA
ncbi:hypothetical protein ZEAMMB73_Zm00001d040966 [Zea mays]|uniref:Uncharacterized protein n=1 Tax=Zea mays TaxID=4577 RepID=A0A1D6MTM0_MAIZE|nr:hypothetical protein ZEAMMB73_Zm00001d040966 [Zea mays]